MKIVFVNKLLYLGQEKDVSSVKQGNEMSNHCLRQDQGLMVSVEHPHPNPGFWGRKLLCLNMFVLFFSCES